ncbi:MAG: tetratricopeptide repeat protein [Deltaproteobacteria bacterium]|nr:tetratricopeptide repeat protein [Deltaproteobacteria bacterium]
MQLTLFQWDLIAVGKGCASLARLDFGDARSRFAGVLNDLPGHAEALRGMWDLQFWEDVFREMEGMAPEFVPGFLWEKITGFPFENSENYQALRRNLLRRLLALLDDRPTFYAPPDLCSGYLHLLLGDYPAAETRLRLLIGCLPENGRLQGYLADALYMQGRTEIAAAVYAKALLLAPHEVAVETMATGPWWPLLKNTARPWRRSMVFCKDFCPWWSRERNRSAGKAGRMNCCGRRNRQDASAISGPWWRPAAI